MLPRRTVTKSLACACLLAAACQVKADVITWSTPGTTWDTSTATWTGDDTVFANGDTVTFANTGNTAITIQAAGVAPASTTFANNAQNYTFTGGAITSGSVTVNGGTQTLNNTINTYNGTTTINAGTLAIGPGSGITGTTATVNFGGTLAFLGSSSTSNTLVGNVRYGDSTALNLYGGTLSITNTTDKTAVTETVGTLNYTGEARINFTRTGTDANSNVVFQFDPNRQDRGLLVMGSNSLSTVGTTANTRQWVTVTGTAPTVTNGMVAPHYLVVDTATGVVNFATYGNTAVVGGRPTTSFRPATLTSASTALNTAGTTGSGTDLWDVVASSSTSGTLGSGSLAVQGATKNIYALRSFRSLSSASGTTITLNGGGLILQPNSAVGGSPAITLGTGISLATPSGTELVVYAGGTSDKTHTISGAISGDNGLTKGGVASLVLGSTSNAYTGTTTVNAGVLTINGSIADGMAHIAKGATLNGSGTINYQIVNNIADLITVKGILDITNLKLNLQLSGTQTSGTTYVLADYTAGTLTGSQFATTNVGSLTGWSINYNDANRITLTYNVGVSPASIVVTPNAGSRSSGQTVNINATPDNGTYTIGSTAVSGYGWSQSGISNGAQAAVNNDKTGTLSHNTTNAINGDNQGRFSFNISDAASGNGTYSYTLTNTVAGNVAPYGTGSALGTTQTATILNGNTVSGYSVAGARDTSLNQLGNTFTIQTSAALTADTDLTMAIRRRVDGGPNDEVTAYDGNFDRFANNAGKLYSDVVEINGIDGTLYVLTISYNPADLNMDELGLRLGWLNDSNKWVIAVLGNTGGVYQDLGDNPWTIIGSLGAEDLGKFGVNTTGNYVWAVLNHNSQFAVIPEPTSLALLGLGAAGLLMRRRRS